MFARSFVTCGVIRSINNFRSLKTECLRLELNWNYFWITEITRFTIPWTLFCFPLPRTAAIFQEPLMLSGPSHSPVQARISFNHQWSSPLFSLVSFRPFSKKTQQSSMVWRTVQCDCGDWNWTSYVYLCCIVPLWGLFDWFQEHK